MNSPTMQSRAPSPSPSHGRWRSKRFLALSALAVVTITASTLSAGPAQAATVDVATVEQTLRQAGAVHDVAPASAAVPTGTQSTEGIPSAVSGASLSLATGLTVATGPNSVVITPVIERSSSGRSLSAAARARADAAALSAAAKSLSPSGLAVYANTADSSFAFSTATTGGNAGYAVISGPSAPTVYRFALTADGAPAVLRPDASGGVDVLNSSGALVNHVAPAWAKDATDAAVATSYSVSGNILVQSVAHAGAAYPVVADPRIVCDSLWCSAELSRAETRQVAAGSFPPAALCAWFGPAGRVCSALFLAGWAQANVALAIGKCIAFRIWKANFVSYPHLAYVPCYA